MKTLNPSRRHLLGFALAMALCPGAVSLAQAAEPRIPKVAVTDLTYEEKVKEYFNVYHARQSSSASGSYHAREREGANGSYSASESERFRGRSDSEVYAASGTVTYIERGELFKFTADIKGQMLRAGGYRLMQGKPVPGKDMDKLHDIIARIKQGLYPGADYVLFGSVSNIDWRQESMPLKGTDSQSATLALDLVADFSLINTKTYEIKASFSAMGSGQDVRLLQPGMRVQLNRSKVIQEVSRSLGEDVAKQLDEQFRGYVEGAYPGGYPPPGNGAYPADGGQGQQGGVIIYR